jgi:hypothetical protein
MRLRRRRVLDEQHDRARKRGELAIEALEGVPVAEDPAAAVAVEHQWERTGRAGRPDYPDVHLPGRPARDDAILDVGRRHIDLDARLDVTEQLARVLRRELVQRRLVRGVGGEPVDPALGGRFEARREGVSFHAATLRRGRTGGDSSSLSPHRETGTNAASVLRTMKPWPVSRSLFSLC